METLFIKQHRKDNYKTARVKAAFWIAVPLFFLGMIALTFAVVLLM